MNNSQFPIARKNGLVIQEMPDEVLVYDLDTNKAISLNETAATVWRLCTGKNSVADIARRLGGRKAGAETEKVVMLALDQLNEKDLLLTRFVTGFEGKTRREVLKQVGFATALALPVVAMLSFPSVSLGATCLASGCNTSAGCLAGEICCPSTINPGTFECFLGLPGSCGSLPGTATC